jgi:hypothetical protein
MDWLLSIRRNAIRQDQAHLVADADGKEQREGGVMYLIESMIDMGLKDGQKWPSPAHRRVACTLAIGNPMIRTRDELAEIVQKVCKIPKTQIRKVGYYDLAKYGINFQATA